MTSSPKNGSAPACHGLLGEDIRGLLKVVIVGNPNVGKSMVFNALTGAYVTVSNYPGTTVAIDTGRCSVDGEDFGVIDSPGMYSLIPITEEERIAKRILLEECPGIVLHIVDAKNLERMLPLTLQLLEADLPVILVVNMMDEAEELGIVIDFDKLETTLGIPVVPTVATTGRGLDDLLARVGDYSKKDKVPVTYQKTIESSIEEMESLIKGEYPISRRIVSLLLLQQDNDMQDLVREKEGKRYERLDEITRRTDRGFSTPMTYVIKMRMQRAVTKILSTCETSGTPHETTWKERLSRVMIQPMTGIPILFLVLYFGLYQFVGVFGAGDLVDLLEGTIFGEHINPIVTNVVVNNVPNKAIQELIVGEYGIVSLGLTYAIAIIFPIVGTFFLAFSVIEDSGYLPRLALLMDRVLKKIGLTGRAVIPMVLGLGCDTMATIVVRTQETKRERVISTLLLALAVPCSAQLGVIFAILAAHPQALYVWAAVIMLNFLLVGYLATKVLPGEGPSFFMELPPLRLPKLSNVLIKTYTRMTWYFWEVLPLFIIASVLIWGFQLLGIFQVVIRSLEPAVNLIGLPDETAKVFLFGFFRRDYGAAGLYDMQDILTGVQLTVAAVTLTLFMPCIAQFMVMIKERGMRMTMAMVLFILFFAFGVGATLNIVLNGLGVVL